MPHGGTTKPEEGWADQRSRPRRPKDFPVNATPTAMNASNDKVLAARMLAGEERAFSEFFDAYFGPLYRFAMSRLNGNGVAAEDAVQSAMSKAVTKLATYRGEATLLTWLCTFCRHEISTYWRGESRQPHLAEDVAEIEAALESIALATDDDPEQRARRNETARLVHVALDHLPRTYADVLDWKYIEAVPVTEIAQRLGISAKAAESQLTRARGAFRDAFTALLSGGLKLQNGEVR
jgi:RNA polymerase sigma-70 factor (ECF subfamily)